MLKFSDWTETIDDVVWLDYWIGVFRGRCKEVNHDRFSLYDAFDAFNEGSAEARTSPPWEREVYDDSFESTTLL